MLCGSVWKSYEILEKHHLCVAQVNDDEKQNDDEREEMNELTFIVTK